ncbi:MAG: hypothetical protein AB7O26_00730 [Planctomycetaceae bacterium]
MKSLRPTDTKFRRGTKRPGIVLIVVLVVVVIISLAGFSFVAFMFTENKGVRLRGEELQAAALVDSGEESLKQFLEQSPEQREEAGTSENNPDRFRAIAVIDDEESKQSARFSIISTRAPEDPEFDEPIFGAENESSRLNLAAVLRWEQEQPGAGRRALMSLPGMTLPIAGAILDWIDADSSEREGGAEADYYAGLDPAYAPRNALPESFEELLLVKGITRELLFGDGGRAEDAAQDDFALSDDESSVETSSPPARSRTSQDHVAWASLLTWQSAERNVNREGRPRINLNAPDLAQLHQSLAEVLDDRQARFIVMFRQYGPALPVAAAADDSTVVFNPSLPARFPIVSIMDLIDARVSVPAATGNEPIAIASPFTSARDQMRQYLPKLLDDVMLDASPVQIGRVNINSAHPAVLAAIPGIDRALVDQILTARSNQARGDESLRNQPGWLLTEGIVDIAKLRTILPYITCGGDVHRAEIVGFFDGPGPSARREVVIDATNPPARLVYWKDLRSLDARYPLELIGTEDESLNQNGPNRPRAGRRNMLTQASRSSR